VPCFQTRGIVLFCVTFIPGSNTDLFTYEYQEKWYLCERLLVELRGYHPYSFKNNTCYMIVKSVTMYWNYKCGFCGADDRVNISKWMFISSMTSLMQRAPSRMSAVITDSWTCPVAEFRDRG
jgi:hypothetical protein